MLIYSFQSRGVYERIRYQLLRQTPVRVIQFGRNVNVHFFLDKVEAVLVYLNLKLLQG